jgi:DNA mismatch repair protein MutS2
LRSAHVLTWIVTDVDPARHPLLEDNLRREQSSMTPVSLDIGPTRRILVISGPNAGGKTVVLKTAG